MIEFRHYPLSKPLVVNGGEFVELIISSHYEVNHGSYMTDEKILEIVKQLDKKNGFVPRYRGKFNQWSRMTIVFLRTYFL